LLFNQKKKKDLSHLFYLLIDIISRMKIFKKFCIEKILHLLTVLLQKHQQKQNLYCINYKSLRGNL